MEMTSEQLWEMQYAACKRDCSPDAKRRARARWSGALLEGRDCEWVAEQRDNPALTAEQRAKIDALPPHKHWAIKAAPSFG